MAGAVYCWESNSNGQLGDESTSPSVVPARAAPQAPTGVTALPWGPRAAVVFWAPPAFLNGGVMTGYTATVARSVAACSTTGRAACLITGLAGNTTYSITVIAHTTAGDSAASMPATVTTPPVGPRGRTSRLGQPATGRANDYTSSDSNDWECHDPGSSGRRTHRGRSSRLRRVADSRRCCT